MVQQQRKGGNIIQTASNMVSGGHIGRGFFSCAMREGLYAAAYLGVAPLIRRELQVGCCPPLDSIELQDI